MGNTHREMNIFNKGDNYMVLVEIESSRTCSNGFMLNKIRFNN